jgi:glutamate dehydrogenase/leucine dehydrogenase
MEAFDIGGSCSYNHGKEPQSGCDESRGVVNTAECKPDAQSNYAEAENDGVVPEAVHSFLRENGQVLGHPVIDSTINGLSAGAMTLKYSFLKWPFGGAKAAIVTHRENLSPQERRECVEAFARRLAPFRDRYEPGEDAGTNAGDLQVIRRVLSPRSGATRRASRAARRERTHRAPDSAFYTGMTVRICVERMAKELHLEPPECAVAVEGFGKVGGWVARQLAGIGCRIVAVSTCKGGVYQSEGLDTERLLRARTAVGDDCIGTYGGTGRIRAEQLWDLPVDFLIPCALSWSIRQANADRIKARAIVCGANNAVTAGAREALAARGVVCFPDFVSNCGGALGSIIETLCSNREKAMDILRQQFEPKLDHLFVRARSAGRSLDAAAREIAAENRQEMKQHETVTRGRLFSLAAGAFRHGLLPPTVVKVFAPAFIRRTMA